MSAVDYLCTAIAFNDQADPAQPPADRIAAWKRVGDNSLYFRTVNGIERCATQATGLGQAASYTQLIIDGTSNVALLVDTADEKAILTCNTADMQVTCAATTTITGDVGIGGQINAQDSQVLDVENAAINLSAEQKTTDIVNQGFYSSYTPVGGELQYRGLLYYTDIGRFAYSDSMVTEPSSVAAANLQGTASFGTLQLAATSNQLRVGPVGGSIILNQNIPAGGQLTYIMPNVEADAQFVLLHGTSTINGTKTAAHVTTSGPIYGTTYDYQVLTLSGYLNATNTNVAKMNALSGRLSNVPVNQPAISVLIRFGDGVTAGIVEYGVQQIRLYAGTYRVIFQYRRQSNHCICELYCTALGLSLLMDGYSATVIIGSSTADFVVPVAGIYDFAFRQNGKNPSSGGFFFDFWPFVDLQQIA